MGARRGELGSAAHRATGKRDRPQQARQRGDRGQARRLARCANRPGPLREVEMRLVATEYLSLDGVFEEPGHWSGPMFNEEAGQFKWAELQASDGLLLGRKTYEGFAAAWPTMKGTGEFGEKMNSMPKYVVSSTLAKADWPGAKL